MFKLLKNFLVILGSIALTILISSQLAQATVTNGNIRYFEGDQEFSTSETSTTPTTSTSSDGVVIKPSGSSGTGNFLKTNDTVNYIFVVVGVIFVLIAVYNLKKT